MGSVVIYTVSACNIVLKQDKIHIKIPYLQQTWFTSYTEILHKTKYEGGEITRFRAECLHKILSADKNHGLFT
jgi:hypothetical protein